VAGKKQKSHEIMKMQMYAILGEAKLDTENIRGVDLATVKRTTRSSDNNAVVA
jgi:hypothetical protein